MTLVVEIEKKSRHSKQEASEEYLAFHRDLLTNEMNMSKMLVNHAALAHKNTCSPWSKEGSVDGLTISFVDYSLINTIMQGIVEGGDREVFRESQGLITLKT